MFEEAQQSVKSGDFSNARKLLTHLLKEERENPQYWLWMSMAVETKKERLFCLKELYRLDPKSRAARYGLGLAGEIPPDPSLAIPLKLQVNDWEKRFLKPAGPKPNISKLIGQLAVIFVTIAVFIVAGYFLITNTVSPYHKAPTLHSIIGATATASATPSPAAGTSVGPVGPREPLWTYLEATYTPTALYVSTPHPLLEAYSAGLRAYARGDWTQVLNYMQQVVTAEGGALDAYYLMGEAYRFSGEYDKAIGMYNTAIAKNANFAPAYLGRARTRLMKNAKDFDTAEVDFQKAMQLDPNMGETYIDYAAMLIRNKKEEDALGYLDTAGRLLPDSPLVNYYRAEVYMIAGQIDQALEQAQIANQRDITMLPVYRLIGEILQMKGKYTESLDPLETYVAYDGQDTQAWAMLGRAFQANGDLQSALDSYAKAIAAGAGGYEIYIQRGYIYLDQDKGDLAEADFTKALRTNSTSFDANLGLGIAYVKTEQYGNAYTQLSRTEAYMTSGKDKAKITYWRALSLEGLVAESQVKVSAAVKEWQNLLAMPTSDVPQEWREAAIQHLEILRTSTPSPTPSLTPTVPTATITRTPTVTRTPTKTITPTVKPTTQ